MGEKVQTRDIVPKARMVFCLVNLDSLSLMNA